MDVASLVAFGLVSTVGCLSALKNWTSLALVWNYIIVTSIWAVTGEASLHAAILADYLVLVVIFIKVNNDCAMSPGPWGWAKDCWIQASWWDKTVVYLFIPVWITYAVTMPAVWAFWIAWTAAVLQLFAASGEALEVWYRGRTQAEDDDPTDESLTRRQGLAGNEC